ncbi:hypothetical protein [Candidatus Mycobacterium wuenschmannii]|uniref:hypothetical protein n=1 Tax=Candidatus Mycobacterium wuenschmannii TaxID=3027808 RepID=UPI0036F441C1
MAGHLPAFEAQATAWQSGQHQPDALAAATVAYDVLGHGAGFVHISSAFDAERRARQGQQMPPQWMRRRIGG